MQHGRLVAAREGAAVAGVEIALGGQALGQQNVMGGQFDMPIGDGLHRHLRDGAAVHEVTDGDQHAVDEHGMVG